MTTPLKEAIMLETLHKNMDEYTKTRLKFSLAFVLWERIVYKP